jgi:lysophospholipase L1-like esterase
MGALLPAALAGNEPLPATFSFSGAAPAGATAVEASTTYSHDLGYGYDLGTTPSADNPYYFSIAVPEGDYDVTVTLGDATAATVTTVKAESRRLMLERIETAPGQFVTRTFTVNVRNASLPASGDYPASQVLLNPREKGVLHWDDKLTLEFDGPHSGLVSLTVAPTHAIRVFIAGDSTVTDQPREPWNSWGQSLTRFFQPGVAVANHAESGETLKAFIFQRRLEKVLSQIRPGDYLFIQFAHNDMKRNWPATYVDAFTTYEAYLKVFIAEARLRGAIPVLCTPVNRRTFNAQGKITNSLGNYPAAVRQVAAEEKVPLIDLNAMTKRLYEAMGPAVAKKAFVDGTHSDDYGSYEVAKCVAEGIRESGLPLAALLSRDFAGFDPDHPDPIDGFDVPPSPGRSEVKPLGN